MKILSKAAALALTLCLTSAALLGCRSEAKLAEDLEVARSGIEKATSLESGEIMVYATFKTEKEVGEKLRSSVTESYTKFVRGESLEYDFTRTEKFPYSDITEFFDASCEGGKTIVTRDGVVVDESEAPDIFEAFNIDYTVEGVEDIVVIELDAQTLYTVTMKPEYAAKFSSNSDGIDSVCKQVKYNYYIDPEGVVRTVVSEFTSEVTCDGVEQTVVSFCQTAIN